MDANPYNQFLPGATSQPPVVCSGSSSPARVTQTVSAEVFPAANCAGLRMKTGGADVIIVHRLLKNSVPATQYLLLTEAARRELQFPETMRFKSSSETYEDFGRIKTEFRDFDFAAAPAPTNEVGNFGARYRK